MPTDSQGQTKDLRIPTTPDKLAEAVVSGGAPKQKKTRKRKAKPKPKTGPGHYSI